MVHEDEKVWIFCDRYPRHKQVSRESKRDARNKMIMSHATQGGYKQKGSSSRGRMHMWTQAGFRMDF